MTHDARAAEAVRIGITNRMIMGGCSPEAAANALDLLRDQFITEAAELIRRSRGALNGAEWPDHCAALLLATRTNQEG